MLPAALAVLLLATTPADSTLRHADRADRAATRPRAERPTMETWQVDPARSELAFRVRRFVSTVRGRFAQWTGTVRVDPSDWMTAQVTIDIATASIDTGDPERDARLRAPDFFAADSFPLTTFRSTSIERRDGGALTIGGLLTLHGVTKPVMLEVTRLDVQRDPEGRHRAAITARGTIDRTAFGVTWNRVVEGTKVVGEEVELEISMELVRPETLGRR